MRTIPIMYLFASASILASCSSNKEEKTETANEASKTSKGIETLVLNKELMATSIQLPGELIAHRQVDLYAKVSSFVKELKVDIGSEVSEGQLLATLEAPELSSQLLAASSKLQAQEAIYNASKANYERLLETSKVPGTVSPNDLDQATAKKNADYAQLDAAKAMYKEISTMKSYLEIRAPFAGVITMRNVNQGAYVGPAGKGSESPIFTLQEQKLLRLAISVPEAWTGYLRNDNEVSFRVKALPNEEFHTKIKRLAGALDLRLRSERVEMDVTNTNKKLLPGMVAEVTLPLPARDSTFIVPTSSVVNSAEGIYVIKVIDHKVQRVNVRTGRMQNDKIEIFGELTAGDILAVKANEELRNGTIIN